MSTNGKHLTPAEAGKILGIQESRVRQLLRAGKLKGKRTPQARLRVEWSIDPASVRRWAKVKPPKGRPKKKVSDSG